MLHIVFFTIKYDINLNFNFNFDSPPWLYFLSYELPSVTFSHVNSLQWLPVMWIAFSDFPSCELPPMTSCHANYLPSVTSRHVNLLQSLHVIWIAFSDSRHEHCLQWLPVLWIAFSDVKSCVCGYLSVKLRYFVLFELFSSAVIHFKLNYCVKMRIIIIVAK